MENENTVTISIDVYFDLRQKAEMNAFLMAELGRTQQALSGFETRLYELENEIRRIEHGI